MSEHLATTDGYAIYDDHIVNLNKPNMPTQNPEQNPLEKVREEIIREFEKVSGHIRNKCADCVINGFGCPFETKKAFLSSSLTKFAEAVKESFPAWREHDGGGDECEDCGFNDGLTACQKPLKEFIENNN